MNNWQQAGLQQKMLRDLRNQQDNMNRQMMDNLTRRRLAGQAGHQAGNAPGAAPRGGAWDAPSEEPPPSASGSFRASSGPGPVRPTRGSGAPAGFPSDGGLVGQVRGLQVRAEPYRQGVQRAIWSFRVERYDEVGNRVLLLPVEMRGLFFQGSIREGEWVCVHGKRQGGTLRATRLENLTTGAVVAATGVPKRVKTASSVFAILFAIVFISIMILIIAQAASAPY
jgi:hypothetical protein